jgi:hypothetical protein
MPALIVLKINITGLAQHGDRSVSFKRRILLTVGMSPGILTAGHHLRGAIL